MSLQSWGYVIYTFDANWVVLYHPDIHFEHGNDD